MADPDLVVRRLREIDRRVAALRAVRGSSREAFLEDSDRQALAERHLQVAIQAAIDIALHVVADDTGETPEDYGSAFVLLAREGVLPPPLGHHLRLAAGLRNVLVHAYADVDASQLWDHLDDVDDLTEFAGYVSAYLQGDDALPG